MRVKLYAVFLGPAGLGLISQFLTFISLITTIIHIGTPFSLSSILPSLYKSGDVNSRQKIFLYFKYFILLFLFVTVVVTIIIFLFSSNITYILVDSENENYVLKIIAFSIPFTVVYAIFESFLRSSGQINKMVKVTVLTTLITLPSLIVLVYYSGIEGIAYYILLGSIVPFVIMLFFYKNVFPKEDRNHYRKLSSIEIRNVFKAGITSFFAFLFNQLVILYLRKFIISNFGNDDNGIYQSVLGLSMNLFAFMYSFLGNHTLTEMSMYKVAGKDDAKLTSIINESAKFILLLVVPILVIIYSYRKLIIVLLYSEKFDDASNLLSFQFIGDSFRIFASLFSLWLFARMKIRVLIIIDLIFNFSLFLLPNLLLIFIQNDLRIVPVAYMVASGIQFLLFFLYTKKTVNFHFRADTKKSILISLIIIFSALLISAYFSNIGLYLSWCLLFIWGYLVVHKIEKISLKNIYRNIVSKM